MAGAIVLPRRGCWTTSRGEVDVRRGEGDARAPLAGVEGEEGGSELMRERASKAWIRSLTPPELVDEEPIPRDGAKKVGGEEERVSVSDEREVKRPFGTSLGNVGPLVSSCG